MLQDDFAFSQTSLQDFAECPALFDLRYRRHIVYPAAQSEPLDQLEDHMARGATFHTLVQQHQVGVPPDALEESIDDDQLFEWWQAYLTTPYAAAPTPTRVEISLSAPVAGNRLIAKYDLIAIDADGVFTIIDWKTSIKRPKREFLAARWQTRVYPYVLVEAGRGLNGGKAISPEKVRMVYWFPEHPRQPEVFSYDSDQHAATGMSLTTLIQDIARRGDDDFPLTDEVRRCGFCEYRGLHTRGIKASDWMGEDNDIELNDADAIPDFTLDQIAEVEF